jgi:hypothetical protein
VAQQALPPGAARRRAVFGLLDANGWTWASVKAGFWFLVIVFLLGYIPDKAYYFTVSNTVEVGHNFASVVNWCPAENEDLPCPAPAGAVLPWQTSPDELALPEPRAGSTLFQSGTHLYLLGGETPAGATAETLTTDVTLDGNFEAPWTSGPALPEPRTDAALAVFVGTPYVIGGLDASGQPTDTVFMGQVEEGRLTGWVRADGSDRTPDLTLPHPVSSAGVAVTSRGILLVGGRSADGPTDGVYASTIGPTSPPVLGAWEPWEHLALPEARADAAVLAVGETIYVVGGEGPDGVADSVYRIRLEGGEPAVDARTDEPLGWAIAPEGERLPEPRAGALAFIASSALYVVGGVDEAGAPQASNLWAVPDTVTGDLGGWQRMPETDLPDPRARAPIASVASMAFAIGGETADGLSATSVRSELAPRPPFFQLGLFGATVPALSIKEEIGQQLGYLNAMGVGMTNFVILIIIALALSRPEASARVLARLSRGRLRAPAEDRYRS